MTIHPFAFAGMHQIEQNEYVNTILGKGKYRDWETVKYR